MYSFYLSELSAEQPDVEIVGPSFLRTMELIVEAFIVRLSILLHHSTRCQP